jgi:nucleotide-binding universal stress UspA family protein
MSIVCAVDFSDHSADAVAVAGALAASLREPLSLVHAMAPFGPVTQLPSIQATLLKGINDLLGQEADRLRQIGVTAKAELLEGTPDEVVVAHAKALNARVVVVSALGYRSHGWGVGSVADRIAQTSPIPVLIVRRPEVFQTWTRKERPLRVMLGADFSATYDAAIQWLHQLRQIAPCDVLVTHVSWKSEERQRRGVREPSAVEPIDPETELALIRDLAARVGELPGDGSLKFEIRAGTGLIADQLVQLADESRADLVVVGTHQRGVIGRWWYGSVSQGVLHAASMSVACVPAAILGEKK